MACGLEVRPPFVDHELLELAGSLPSAFKVRNGETKWILKRLFQDRLPTDICHRPKQGFEIPVDQWLSGPLRDVFEAQVLAPSCPASDLVDQTVARRIYRSHVNGTGRLGSVLWSLLVLGCWAEQYMGKSEARNPKS
jgi:asparagine synthase (glutamine-hydrolysing)